VHYPHHSLAGTPTQGQNSLSYVLDLFLTTKRPARRVFPLMIECEPVNEKQGVGNWVAVEYDVVYVEAGHVGQNMVSAAYRGVGYSLRNDSHALDSRYMVLLYALFSLGSDVDPLFLTEATSNLTTVMPPFGCGLPQKKCGNEYAVYTLATICATRSMYLYQAENSLKKSSFSMCPFKNDIFDGCGEAKGRAMIACLALVRMYQFGR
jgi:hypothetical protein